MANNNFDSMVFRSYDIADMAKHNFGVNMDKKICTRCERELNITRFKTYKYTPDGRTNVCRWCYENNKPEKRTWTPEQKEAHRKKFLGRKYTLEHRMAIARGQKRAVEEGRHHWKKNDKPHPDAFRTHLEYKLWKKTLLERAGFKCEDCGSTKRLHAHHIECYYKNNNLRSDLNNGIILCQSCHLKEHWRIRKGERRKYE